MNSFHIIKEQSLVGKSTWIIINWGFWRVNSFKPLDCTNYTADTNLVLQQMKTREKTVHASTIATESIQVIEWFGRFSLHFYYFFPT